MEIELLNEILSNLQYPNEKVLEFIEKKETHIGVTDGYAGNQGEENTFDLIYKVLPEKDIYLKVEYYTDSYGGGEYMRGAKFVKAKKKEVTVYE